MNKKEPRIPQQTGPPWMKATEKYGGTPQHAALEALLNLTHNAGELAYAAQALGLASTCNAPQARVDEAVSAFFSKLSDVLYDAADIGFIKLQFTPGEALYKFRDLS